MSFTTSATAATTASTSASGTGCAARTRGWAALPIALLALGGATPQQAPSATASLQVDVEGLRDRNGLLRFCLTRAADYLKCDKDPAAVRLSIPASSPQASFPHLPIGEWSLLLIHDSNGNGKLDTRFGIPREGFGFSRNPTIGFGPPRAEAVRFALPAGMFHQTVRLRYIL